MNWELFVELFVALSLLVAGVTTLAFRKRRNPFIGFRVGYTYHSKRAWERTNTTIGVFFVVGSLVLLLLAFEEIPLNVFILVSIAFSFVGIFIGMAIAKREYEMEDLSTEAPEKPSEELRINMTPYLIAQVAFLGAYLLMVALLWDRLPQVMATHFDAGGNPNGFSDKFWGAVGVPVLVWGMFFALTLPARDPGFFAKAKLYPTSWKAWGDFMTSMSAGLLIVSALGVLYNVGLVSSHVMIYGVYLIIVIAVVGIYRLLRVKKDERV